MYKTYKSQIQSALAGMALAASSALCSAVQDLVLGTFDSDASTWGKAWGSAAPTFDPMQDSTGNGGGAC